MAKPLADVDVATTCESTSKEKTSRALKDCEVMLSIESLYADELKPFGRILRKRVAERIAIEEGVAWVPGSEENLPIVSIADLLSICEGNDRVSIEPEAGGDWCALLLDRPRSFVDVYCPDDIYPSSTWEDFEQYLLAQRDDMSLPGGRYSCAQVLQLRNLQFFHGRSLGQLCHIVQLAISKKKLLGYLNGAIVPYRKSQSMVKEQCAMRAEPCAISNQVMGDTRAEIADLETARRCMRVLLDNAALTNDGVGTIPLSNVKRFLRSKFNVELSETMLGHSKLSDLLQDSKFSDICTVRLQKHGYIVFQVQPDVAIARNEYDTEPHRVELHSKGNARICGFDEPLTLDLDDTSLSSLPSPARSRKSALARDPFSGDLVQRTFIHAPLPPQTPLITRHRSRSLPKDHGSQRKCHDIEDDGEELARPNCPRRSDSTESTVESITALNLEASFVGADLATLSSPSPFLYQESCTIDSFSRLACDAPTSRCNTQAYSSFDFRMIPSECQYAFDRRSYCDSAEPAFLASFGAHPGKHRFLSPPTSCKEGSIGSIGLSRIQNTFIHSPIPPPTPSYPGSACRSRSLPKDIGSGKNHWEATCQALGCEYVEENTLNDFGSSYGFGWGPTPNVYTNPKGLYSMSSSPVVFANSPALTASPIDCPFGSAQSQKILLRLATGPCPLIDQTYADAPFHPRAICLADLVE